MSMFIIQLLVGLAAVLIGAASWPCSPSVRGTVGEPVDIFLRLGYCSRCQAAGAGQTKGLEQ